VVAGQEEVGWVAVGLVVADSVDSAAWVVVMADSAAAAGWVVADCNNNKPTPTHLAQVDHRCNTTQCFRSV